MNPEEAKILIKQMRDEAIVLTDPADHPFLLIEAADHIETLEEERRWRVVPGPYLPQNLKVVIITRKGQFESWVCAGNICFFNGNWVNEDGTIISNVIAWRPLPKPYQPK